MVMKKTTFCFKQSFFCFICILLCSCQQKLSCGQKSKIENFPPQMVGTWDCQFGPLAVNRWQITFNPDGTIPKIYHYVFGELIVSDGGIYKDGPDPNTYMVVALGPVDAEYDPATKILTIEVVIDDYEMKLPAGTLKGRIIDKLTGKISEDGKTWNAEWRSYGWLEGAAEPPIEEIDANPQHLPFLKVEPNQ